MAINMQSPAKAWILQARENAPDAFVDGVKFLFNCEEAEIDGEGDIWISGPQRGHWLDADDLERVGRALKAGEI